MKTNKIIDLLKERETGFLQTPSFSKFPGIYAFFYVGKNFPLFGNKISKHQIIYIGKTESSQEKRDASTHFTTGKTGSSTVRKSIGSILNSQDNLKPIPRNDNDYERGRLSHFKFDSRSEEKITDLMKRNLALSFYECPLNKQFIDELETEIIQELEPILNIDHKNPKNPYKARIKQLRKDCAMIALKGSKSQASNTDEKAFSKPKKKSKIFKSPNLRSIYVDNITKGDVKSRRIRIKAENKYLFPEEKSGNSISYSLDFKTAHISFNATYTIGSKDGKSRSGVLKLGKEIYLDILKIRPGTILKLNKSSDGYTIERI